MRRKGAGLAYDSEHPLTGPQDGKVFAGCAGEPCHCFRSGRPYSGRGSGLTRSSLADPRGQGIEIRDIIAVPTASGMLFGARPKNIFLSF